MILTESQSLQLASILIEATDEKGPGFVAKVKDVIKRAAKWIKKKAIFLATKIKEGFTKVVKLVLQPATKLLANSKFFQEYARSFKEKDIDADYVPELKKYFEVFEKANNAVFAISSEMHKLTGKVDEEHLEEFRGHLDKALNVYAKAMNEYEEIPIILCPTRRGSKGSSTKNALGSIWCIKILILLILFILRASTNSSFFTCDISARTILVLYTVPNIETTTSTTPTPLPNNTLKNIAPSITGNASTILNI